MSRCEVNKVALFWPVSEELLEVLINDGYGNSLREYLENHRDRFYFNDPSSYESEARKLIRVSGLQLTGDRYFFDGDLGFSIRVPR